MKMIFILYAKLLELLLCICMYQDTYHKQLKKYFTLIDKNRGQLFYENRVIIMRLLCVCVYIQGEFKLVFIINCLITNLNLPFTYIHTY